MQAKTAFGNGSNNGPIRSMTTNITNELNTEPNCDFPFEASRTLLRDNEDAHGKQEKNEPKIFDPPYAYNSCVGSIEYLCFLEYRVASDKLIEKLITAIMTASGAKKFQ